MQKGCIFEACYYILQIGSSKAWSIEVRPSIGTEECLEKCQCILLSIELKDRLQHVVSHAKHTPLPWPIHAFARPTHTPLHFASTRAASSSPVGSSLRVLFPLQNCDASTKRIFHLLARGGLVTNHLLYLWLSSLVRNAGDCLYLLCYQRLDSQWCCIRRGCYRVHPEAQ